MAYGLQTRDTNGDVNLTIDRKLCRLIYQTIAPANQAGNVTLTLTGVSSPSFIALPLDSDEYYRHLPHDVSLNTSTGVLSWARPSYDNNDKFSEYATFKESRTLIKVFGYG